MQADGTCGPGPVDHAFSGTFDSSHEGAYVLVPFEVAEGTTKVRVRICYDQPPTHRRDDPSGLSRQVHHTLDLGLYEPTVDGFYDDEEFRGWGGSSRPDLFVTPETSTVGFLPGPILAGEWAAEIGVAAVVGPEEGDPDGSVAWTLEVVTTSDPADADTPWQPAPYDETPARAEEGWYKGDFHVHAEHSAPNDASMRETFDYAFSARPQGAGLDFITLSDYVTTRHWDEIGRFQAGYPGKLIVRSAEVITYRGHVNNHASVDFVDYRTGAIFQRQNDGTLKRLRDARPASEILEDIHAGGGWTQVNHPTTFPSTVPLFGNICRGCSWEYSDAETDWGEVDAMEVQTGPSGTPGPEGNELGPNPFTPLAIEWWDRLRREAGYDITAVGSSDSHNAGRQSSGQGQITQSPIGEATTVVYAEELSERGIHEAILAGHAYVKFFSSDGPDLRLEASPTDKPGKGKGKGKGPHAMMGDKLKAAEASFTARVLGASAGQPRTLVVLKDGFPFHAAPVTSNDFVFEFTAEEPGDYRLQLQRGSAIEALTNPITLETPTRGLAAV